MADPRVEAERRWPEDERDDYGHEAFAGFVAGAEWAAPRVLTQVVEVTTLPLTAVIETKQGYVMERLSEGWFRPGMPTPYVTVFPNWLPARLLRVAERMSNRLEEES